MKKIFLFLPFAIPGVLFAQQRESQIVSVPGTKISKSVVMAKDSACSHFAPMVIVTEYDLQGNRVVQEVTLPVSLTPPTSPAELIEIMPGDSLKKEK